MKRLAILSTVVAVALAMTMAPAGANLSSPKLRYFFGDKGSANWQSGKDDQNVFVDDSPLDTNHARIKLNVPSQSVNPPYSYAGVYAYSTGLSGKALGAVKNLSFDVMKASAGGYEGAGSPRFSVPIDTNGNGTFGDACGSCTGGSEGYAFMAAGACNTDIGGNWDRADFTGQTAVGCTMYGPDGIAYSSDGTTSAWAHFAAAYPGAKIGLQSQGLAFLILDEVGTAFVDRVAFQNHMFGNGPNSVTNCATEASC